VLICTHPEFLSAHKGQKPASFKNQSTPVPKEMGDQSAFGEKTVVDQSQQRPSETTENTTTPQEVDEWYVLKGRNRYGPFPYLDLLRMLQEKAVFEFDYVWRSGLDTWRRIAELENFSTDKVREILTQTEKTDTQVFFRRRHARADFKCGLLVHDNNRVWKGHTVQVSEGGAGVIMENAMMLPGQNVYLHFKPSTNTKPFNALCEIVSKRYVKGVREQDAPLYYGLKFINIHKTDRDALKDVATEGAA
jgi:hypothetical protein